jgi:hypothetical protein
VLQGPDVIHNPHGLLHRVEKVDECSATGLVLPGAVERVKHLPELPRGPTHPQLGDETTAKSINHGQQAVAIRWDDLRYGQLTPRANRWGANCQSTLSALETDSAEGAWEARCRHR